MSWKDTLMEKLKTGDLEGVRAVMDSNPGAADGLDDNGISFLMHALYHRKQEVADLIRSQRTRVSWHEAAALGETASLRGLLELEPGLLNTYTGDGFTALHLAAFFGRASAVNYLINQDVDLNLISQNPMGLTALHSATAGGSTACVKALLEAGCLKDEKQAGGYTALMSAAAQGNMEMASILVESKVNVQVVDEKGLTARDHAERGGHTAVLEILKS